MDRTPWSITLRKYAFCEPSAASVSIRAVEAQLDVPYCSIARTVLPFGSTATGVNIWMRFYGLAEHLPTLDYRSVYLKGALDRLFLHGRIARM